MSVARTDAPRTCDGKRVQHPDRLVMSRAPMPPLVEAIVRSTIARMVQRCTLMPFGSLPTGTDATTFIAAMSMTEIVFS